MKKYTLKHQRTLAGKIVSLLRAFLNVIEDFGAVGAACDAAAQLGEPGLPGFRRAVPHGDIGLRRLQLLVLLAELLRQVVVLDLGVDLMNPIRPALTDKNVSGSTRYVPMYITTMATFKKWCEHNFRRFGKIAFSVVF
jgi:hypothetical protein